MFQAVEIFSVSLIDSYGFHAVKFHNLTINQSTSECDRGIILNCGGFHITYNFFGNFLVPEGQNFHNFVLKQSKLDNFLLINNENGSAKMR